MEFRGAPHASGNRLQHLFALSKHERMRYDVLMRCISTIQASTEEVRTFVESHIRMDELMFLALFPRTSQQKERATAHHKTLTCWLKAPDCDIRTLFERYMEIIENPASRMARQADFLDMHTN